MFVSVAEDSLGAFTREMVKHTFASDPSGQMHVFLHYRNSIRVDSAELRVLKQGDKISLAGFLHGLECTGLEAHFSIVLSGDFTNEFVKRRF